LKHEKNNNRITLFLVCIALVAITLTLYMQTGSFPFINLDDNLYVTNNPHVVGGITGKNIMWAFTTFDYSYWHPITWLSHMVDVQFYGMNPRGHHLTNVGIHTISSILLLFLLLRLTGALWQSAFVATLFALHPMHVESVAWVAERKDVLSAFFFFITLIFYAEFTAKRKTALYVLSLISFLLGLMSKPMLVTLPIVMLILDFWPLNRFRSGEHYYGLRQFLISATILTKEKTPFFVCSLLSGLVTIYGQYKFGAMDTLNVFPFQLRVENALVAYVKYIFKTLWPTDLAVFYPFPSSIPLWQTICSLVILLLISAAALRAGRRSPYVPVGWFWFIVTLVPVIGLTQVGNQSMADRFSYIPGIGLFIIAAWGFSDISRGFRHRKRILAVLAGSVIIASSALTWQQIGHWQDSVSLYRHSLQVTAGNNFIYGNLGAALIQRGDLDTAIQTQREALRITPDFVDAHHNLGIALAEKGDLDAAIPEYQAALLLSPNDPKLHHNLGVALAGKGNLDAAIKEFGLALRIQPDDMRAHFNRGGVLIRKGDLVAAIREFQEVLRISPDDINARSNLGVALAKSGDLDAAILEFQEILRRNPNDTYAQNNLGRALDQKRVKKDVGY
jgi:protein O-mannosyl-transferase